MISESVILEYQRTQNPALLEEVYKQYEPLLNKAVSTYKASAIPTPVLKIQAHKLAREAMLAYKPGGNFTSFLQKYLRKMYRFVNDNQNVVRMSENHKLMLSKVLGASDEEGNLPDKSQLAKEMGVTPNEMSKLYNAIKGSSYVSDIDSNEATSDANFSFAAREAIQHLLETTQNPRDKKIIQSLLGYQTESLKPLQVAKKYGVSPATVSRVAKKAAIKLHEFMTEVL